MWPPTNLGVDSDDECELPTWLVGLLVGLVGLLVVTVGWVVVCLVW